MNTLFSLHKSRCYIISSFLLVLLSFDAQAQLIRVIDNKGTIANVRNNQVTTALTAPTTPLEGDIWFDSTTAISKVWDGTTWKVIDTDVVTVANMAPTSPAPVEGDIWFNNTNPNTIFANVWNGAVWQPIQNSWLGNTTIHHTITTVLAITQALHNNTDIHIESTGDLSLTSTDVSDATNFYITNTTAADRTLSFTGFTAAHLRNGGPITDLSGGLTLKANTRYLAHITENSGNFYFNATEAGGGESGAISDEDSDTKIQVEEGTDDDTIRFDTDGTERAVISSTGNVGINISDPSDLFQVHSDDISSLSDTATTHEITTVLTQADANWHELISDVTGLYIKPDGLSFGALAVDPANNAHIQSFKEENSETRGIVVGDPTIVVDEVRTSYWYYLVDGGFIKAVLIDFRLNGIALEARRNSARFRSVVSTPDLVTIDRQNNAWFTGAGWTTPGSYQIDLIRVTSKNILGTYPSNVIVATKTGKVGINVDAPSEALEVNGNTYLRGALLDRSGNTGTSGQVLSSTEFGTNWVDSSTVGNDSQTLAIGTTTATETLLTLENSQDLTLTTSGSLSFSRTSSSTLELIGDANQLIDADGDTQIQVEEGTNDDTIRFDTAGIERAVIDAAGNIGIGGVANPQAELHFSNILDNRKLILWQNNSFTNDDHQFYGFGISEGTLRYHVPQVADHVFFGGTSSTTSNELIRIKGTGNVGIGGLGANNIPYTLTVSGTAQVTGAIHDSDGDAGTTGQVLSSTVTGTDWINTTNTITNEMIFDGEDDTSGTYDDYYYISMLINGTDWKVVRYDKTDVNAEAEAMGTGAGNQPITLADCIALTF